MAAKKKPEVGVPNERPEEMKFDVEQGDSVSGTTDVGQSQNGGALFLTTENPGDILMGDAENSAPLKDDKEVDAEWPPTTDFLFGDEGAPSNQAQEENGSSGDSTPPALTRRPSNPFDGVLTIERSTSLATPGDEDDALWHDIQHAFRTHRLLTGTITSTVRTPTGNTHAIVTYNGLTVTIPDSEMGLTLPEDLEERFKSVPAYLNQALNQMMFAEVDFIIRGINRNTRTIVASRRDAMLRKVRNFYFPSERNPSPLIYEGRLVQARIVAAGQNGVRLEVFGIERSLASRFLTWDWTDDVRKKYQVGDEVLLRVMHLDAQTPEKVFVTFSGRDVTEDLTRKRLETIVPQGRYAGTVTSYRKGIYFIHLEVGVNAVAHANMDSRGVGVKDVVCFTASAVDYDTGEALGVITRVIKRNL